MSCNPLQELKNLTNNLWSVIYAQGGILEESKNTSFRGCSVASLLVLSGEPLWFFVEDSGRNKEVELALRIAVDDQFGQEKHESLFRPCRAEVSNFPASCRLDLFLNEKLSIDSQVVADDGQGLLEGVVLANSKGNRLGVFVDEDMPVNLFLSTDIETIGGMTQKK